MVDDEAEQPAGAGAGHPAGDSPGTHHVVIVGGGFAGLFAARALRRAPVRVTMVDRFAHHLFQPLLYQCASGILSEGQIAQPLRAVLRRHRNVSCLQAEATGVDVAARLLHARRPDGGAVSLPYDELVVAAGVRQSYFGHDEFARYAPGMKTLDDALDIRRRIYQAFEMAESARDPDERREWLTFALVGGGPTGVELAGQIREIAGRTLERQYRAFDPAQTRVLLFEGTDEVLAAFGPVLARRALRALREIGVEVRLNTLVTAVDERGLTVREVREGGDADDRTTRYPARTVLWTAGIEAPPFATALARAAGAEQDRAGRLVVRPDLTLPGQPRIRVAGDLMSLDRLPGLAEVAMQSGAYAGRAIRHGVTGRPRPLPPFAYRDLGSGAYIARGRAVVRAGRLNVSGRLGWLGWLFIHIAFLTGFRNRVGAMVSWLIVFASGSRRERAVTSRAPHAVQPPAGPAAAADPGSHRG